MSPRSALLLAALATAACGEIRDATPSATASATTSGNVAATSDGVAILSDGGLTLIVRGASSTSFRNGVGVVKGAGHDIRVEGGWITVDGDRRPLPPGGSVTIDVAAERVIAEGGGKTLAFVK